MPGQESAPAAATVRPLERISEFRACQAIQREAWGITEEGYLMPISLMVSLQRYGGLVLGAFHGDELVGFSLAFLAEVDGRPAFYSQLTGVRPDRQRHGIGYLLKQVQRQAARERGLHLVAWAFDPLQAGNAHFNLTRLGARCRRYQVDMYGSRSDLLNAGLATDRLVAEWAVDGQPLADLGGGEALLQAVPDAAGRPRPLAQDRRAGGRLLIEVPVDIGHVKTLDRALALAWQQAVREAFLWAFGHSYEAVGLRRDLASGRCWYVLDPADRISDLR